MKRRYFYLSVAMLINYVGVFAQSSSSLRGDVNGDGHVDVADITDVVSIIMSNSDNTNVGETDQRNWSELMRLPSREEIDNYNSTSPDRSPYIGAWLDTHIDGNFSMFSVDFKADYLPAATYCSLANFYIDYSSVIGQDNIKNVTFLDGTISGYAGFQRNNVDPKRYNSIISFWDVVCEMNTGEKETIKAKLTKPDNAQESVFTHEGNGVNYIPNFTWRAHKWYRMMLVCVESETSGNTTVEQWLYDISNNSWAKICAFDLGFPNLTFKGQTCVFLENFDKKVSGEIRSLEFKNARVYSCKSKKWIDIESAYFFNQNNLPGSYQFGSDGSTFWMITTGVPNCAEPQENVRLNVKNTENGRPY